MTALTHALYARPSTQFITYTAHATLAMSSLLLLAILAL